MSLKAVGNCPRCGTKMKEKARDVYRDKAIECPSCGDIGLDPKQLRKVRSAIRDSDENTDENKVKIKF